MIQLAISSLSKSDAISEDVAMTRETSADDTKTPMSTTEMMPKMDLSSEDLGSCSAS